MFVSLLMLSVVVGLVGLVVKSLLSTRVNIPEHLLHHPASYTHDMIQMEEFKAINEIMRDLRDFPTNVNAALMNVNFTIKHDHIGKPPSLRLFALTTAQVKRSRWIAMDAVMIRTWCPA